MPVNSVIITIVIILSITIFIIIIIIIKRVLKNNYFLKNLVRNGTVVIAERNLIRW